MYGIWCEVWGGVTGTRSAWLKSNGKMVRCQTYEEAMEIAKRLASNSRRSTTATFNYQVRPLEEKRS